MVDECYKEAVAAQKNELLKAWLVTFDPNDLETTGDLPADQICSLRTEIHARGSSHH